MSSTALYQSVAVVFLAQVVEIDLSLDQLVLLVLAIVGPSMGSAGTPGVGAVILATILGIFGIPSTGLVRAVGVDRILDMSRTAGNMAGDLTLCAFLKAEQPGTTAELSTQATSNG